MEVSLIVFKHFIDYFIKIIINFEPEFNYYAGFTYLMIVNLNYFIFISFNRFAEFTCFFIQKKFINSKVNSLDFISLNIIINFFSSY
jgi:hypothetical protein